MKISLIFLLVVVFSGCLVSAEPFFGPFVEAFGKVADVMGGLAGNVVDGFRTTVQGWTHTLGYGGGSYGKKPESKPESKPDAETKPDSNSETNAPVLGNSTAKVPTTEAPKGETTAKKP